MKGNQSGIADGDSRQNERIVRRYKILTTAMLLLLLFVFYIGFGVFTDKIELARSAVAFIYACWGGLFYKIISA